MIALPCRHASTLAALLLTALSPASGLAQDAELSQKLANPIADLVSVPFQLNHDEGFGPDDEGRRTTLNIQPVYPFRLNDDWTLISRTIVPVIWQKDVLPGTEQSGVGDVLQSFFFVPSSTGSAGLTWGVGPAFGLPTATENALGTGKWTVGPTATVLRVEGPFTYGALFNHLWSVGGDKDRADVNQSFLQPFFSYTSPDAVTLTASAEAVFDWEREAWTVPVNVTAARLVEIGSQPVSLQAGVRYWAESPDGGPEGFGFRFGATLLFPK
jgi:hypothetical protein